MAEFTVRATGNTEIPIYSLAHTLYDAPGGGYSTDTVAFSGKNYVQTITYSGATTTVSHWTPT